MFQSNKLFGVAVWIGVLAAKKEWWAHVFVWVQCLLLRRAA